MSRSKHSFTVVIEKDESGFYVATVPQLKSCYTQARTLKELEKNIREVISLCLEVQGIEEEPELNYVKTREYSVTL